MAPSGNRPGGLPGDQSDPLDQNPFGCEQHTTSLAAHTNRIADDLNSMNGIGLPQHDAYPMPQPQPAGRHILNTDAAHYLNDWFENFDHPPAAFQQGHMPQQFQVQQYGQHDDFMTMPPTFVGSESLLRSLDGREVHDWQMENFLHNNNLPNTDIHGIPGLQQHPNHYQHHLSQPSQSQTPLTPIYSQNFQQQPYQALGQPLQTPGRGPVPNFGSDAQFQSDGHFQVQPQLDTNHVQDDWLSSNPTTRPNTQPSSPVISRKRKSEVLNDPRPSHPPVRNGFHHHHRTTSARFKPDPSELPTPHSLAAASEDSDAHAESDTDFPSRSRTASSSVATTPWQQGPINNTSSSSTTAKSTKPASSKPTPAKRKPSSTNTTRPKPPKPRTSSISTTTNKDTKDNTPKRLPLTTTQKKLNHTSSEQRRRDANARAQARLFDVVPTVRDAPGRLSTFHKLVGVVEFVRLVQEVRRGCEARLGRGGAAGVKEMERGAVGALAGMGSAAGGGGGGGGGRKGR